MDPKQAPDPPTFYDHLPPAVPDMPVIVGLAPPPVSALCPYCKSTVNPGALKCSRCGTNLLLESRDSRVAFAVLSSMFCIGSGLYLLNLRGTTENNLIAMIGNGIGGYCVGKGIYCLGALWPESRRGIQGMDITLRPAPRVGAPAWVQAVKWSTGVLFAALLVSSLLAAAFPNRFTGPMQFWHEHLSRETPDK